MHLRRSFIALILLILAGLTASINAQRSGSPLQINSDFRNGAEGWGLVPSNLTWQPVAELQPLPPELQISGTGFYLNDPADFAYLFIERHLGAKDGIVSGQAYQADFTLMYASNIGTVNGTSCGGYGFGGGGLTVAGSEIEPRLVLDVDGIILNGWGREGTAYVDHLGNGLSCANSRYVSLTRTYHYSLSLTANSKGELWLLAGILSSEGGASVFFQSVNVTLTPVNTVLKFSQLNYSANEGDGSALMTVTRSGDTSGVTTVNFSYTEWGMPQPIINPQSNFEPFFGRLTFGPGETQKTFPVLLIDNRWGTDGGSVGISLSNATAGGTTFPNVAYLTIQNNDGPNGPSPIEDPQFFVRQQYYDFLSRLPDSSGFQYWLQRITTCGSDATCQARSRENVSAAFFLSIEFQRTGYLVYRFYNAALDRANGMPKLLEYTRDTQLAGQDVIVGASGWEQQLEQNLQALALDFVTRGEFTTLYPETMSPAQYVDALYQHAGVTPTTAERQAALDEFSTPVGARARVLRRVAENQTLYNREFNRAFVLMQYFGYLKRNPDDAPDNNLNGYNYWLNKLNQFGGNYQAAEMVKAFVTSKEYYRRFGVWF